MLKKIALVLALFAVSLTSLIFNVAIHEAGHYVVAEAFGLQPRIGFENGVGFIWNNAPIAYTSYIGGTQLQDVLISLAGPLANLLVFAAAVLFYRRLNALNAQAIMLAIAVIALLSFFSNIVPVSGSDGAVLLSAL